MAENPLLAFLRNALNSQSYEETGLFNLLMARFLLANVTVDVNGNISAPTFNPVITNATGLLPIAHGGTNSTTALTNNQVMVSASGAIVEGGAMTNGQLIIGSTGAAPIVATLTAGTGVTVTNAAGSVTLATASASMVKAYNSAVQSISNSTVSAATFDTNDFDTTAGAFHSTSSNTSRFIATTAGKYRLTANLTWAASAAGAIRQAYLRVNGTTDVTGSYSAVGPSAGYTPSHNLSIVLNMSLNDYVEVLIFQDSGGNLNFGAATSKQSSSVCFERLI